MNNMEKSIAELHSMLKTTELNMGNKNKTKDVLMVKDGWVKKKSGHTSTSKGKGPVQAVQSAPKKGKGKGKKVKPNKARTENRCFTCNEVGHWRQNCLKRHEAGSYDQLLNNNYKRCRLKVAQIFDRVANIGRDPQLRLLLGISHKEKPSYTQSMNSSFIDTISLQNVYITSLVLIQSGLHKALKGKPVSNDESSGTGKSEEEWEDLNLRAASTIRLCLANNVLANVHGISTAKELWDKLEQLYQGKGISNRLYLKEQFHTLCMDGGTKISDHLSVLNNVVSELEAIGVKVEDEDKALRLILSLSSSYEHMKLILMYGKETLKFADVTSKLLSEEKRLEGSSMTSSEGTVLVARYGKKKNSGKVTCWKCGEFRHVKSNCPGGVGSAKGSKSDADNVSILMGDDEFC
ncbi:hypothetical protein OSB04_002935 [Centaurea solstitialis]|uniref:CCHC-type domain-containing protein n=1 Tax=Centaurea solstitialis TaxID=347529 RepID=A0AA38TU85_9ASTR|nr:hypothetical protein OSB04_002935 [Centaurea solstitialis]